MKAYMHSCGGWYAAEEDEEGFHHAPPFCVDGGRCYDTPARALRAAVRDILAAEPEWAEVADGRVR